MSTEVFCDNCGEKSVSGLLTGIEIRISHPVMFHLRLEYDVCLKCLPLMPDNAKKKFAKNILQEVIERYRS